MPLLDRSRRPLANLRLSVTDRCNLRCGYCMPEEHYTWLPREDILRFEELARLVEVFGGLGVEKVRLTGGEPLLRRDLDQLVRLIARIDGIRDVALTTNGILLPEHAVALKRAGLGRLTISLDTLDRGRYRALTRRDELERALAGIRAAQAAGFTGTKLNTVVMRGTNDDEIVPLLHFAREQGLELRFIEYMDVGGATQWASERVFPRAEILARIAGTLGTPEPLSVDPSAPAKRWRLADGTRFGIIASTTQPFCGACDRSRLTADGVWYLCLYARAGIDLRGPLRAGATREELEARLCGAWKERNDHGAQERLAAAERGLFVPQAALDEDPHLEMHTRGG